MIVYMHTLAHEFYVMQIHHRCAAGDCGAICDNAFASRAVQTMEEISIECTCIVQVIQMNPFLSVFVKGHLFTP